MDSNTLDDRLSFHRIMALHEMRLRKIPSIRTRACTRRNSFGRPHTNYQRVIVKTYYFTPEKISSTLSYFAKEGKGEDGKAPELFTDESRTVEDQIQPMEKEERYFKSIISPENSSQLDMKEYVRDFMKGLEAGEGREYHWTATVHYDTDNPHAHVMIRGIDTKNRDVEISKETLRYGMRSLASRLATMELGYRTEREIEQQKIKELTAARFTNVDKYLQERSESGQVKPENGYEKERLKYLSDIGLAKKGEKGVYVLSDRFDQKLRALQRENDVLKNVYGKDAAREVKDFAMYRRGWKVEGKIIQKGIENEMTERPFALVQTTSGRKYYIADDKLKDFRDGDSVKIQPGEKGRPDISVAEQKQKKEIEM